jgi:hypothetical protein
VSSLTFHNRAKVAALSRSRPADDPELVAARQALNAARLERLVQAALTELPPLNDEQIGRVIALLRPATGGPRAA